MGYPRTRFARWRYALKPASWPKLFVPATVGQALGVVQLGRVDLAAALVGFALTFLLLAFIVLLNDWADREVDALKRRRFPDGCSPKTIPDGILPARAVLGGGLAAGALALSLAAFAQGWLNRPLLLGAVAGCLLLFAGYSLPPLRLNYRGGGELLEMLGVGGALPWTMAYVQGGLGVEGYLWLPRAGAVLPGLMLLALASAVASGLSDEVSDREGGKTTLATSLGNAFARRLTELSVALGALAWIVAGLVSSEVPAVVAVVAAAVVLYRLRRVVALSAAAVTNAFRAQAAYKAALHAAIWDGGRALALLLVLHRLWLATAS